MNAGGEIRDAYDLWTRNRRFDLVYKIALARAWLRGDAAETRVAERAYLESIRAFNGFHEADPPKSSGADFLAAFRDVVESVRRRGYMPDAAAVPVGEDDELHNGAHRVAACAACGVPCRVARRPGRYDWGYRFFLRRKKRFDPWALAFGLRAYVRLNDRARIVTAAAPLTRRGLESAHAALALHGVVYYMERRLLPWPRLVAVMSFPDGPPAAIPAARLLPMHADSEQLARTLWPP